MLGEAAFGAGLKVLILTAYAAAYVRGLTAAGVAGYVLKDEVPETVVRAIRAVVDGDTWLSRPVVEKLTRLEMQEPLLTEREGQVLRLMARGWDNVQIAAELGPAEQTVRNYVSRIYTRLEMKSRAEVIRFKIEYRNTIKKVLACLDRGRNI